MFSTLQHPELGRKIMEQRSYRQTRCVRKQWCVAGTAMWRFPVACILVTLIIVSGWRELNATAGPAGPAIRQSANLRCRRGRGSGGGEGGEGGEGAAEEGVGEGGAGKGVGEEEGGER